METKESIITNLKGQSMAIIVGALFTFFYFTQVSFTEQNSQTPPLRTIEVVGTAEMALKPDKINLNIQLYFNDNTRKEKEGNLFKILKKHGIEEKDIIYTNNNGNYIGVYSLWYRYYFDYWYYGYNTNRVQTYTIAITSEMNPKEIMSDLTKPLIHNLWIGNSEFSDASEYRKQVKIEAIKAAKEKAKYLLQAVDEELGYVLSIQELDPSSQNNQRYYDPYWGYSYDYPNQNLSSSTSNSVVSSGQNNDNAVQGAASDKLKYGVKVVFSIK